MFLFVTSRRHCHKAVGIHLKQGSNDTYPRSQGSVIPTLAVSTLDHLVVIFSAFGLSLVDVKAASVCRTLDYCTYNIVL